MYNNFKNIFKKSRLQIKTGFCDDIQCHLPDQAECNETSFTNTL